MSQPVREAFLAQRRVPNGADAKICLPERLSSQSEEPSSQGSAAGLPSAWLAACRLA